MSSTREYLIPIGAMVANGKFEVVGTLGQGGMGDVYSVKCLTTDQMMAFKTLLPDQSRNEGIVTRFKEEAESLLRVHASGLPGREYFPRAYAYGYDKDYRIHYMTMEPVNGPDLYQYYTIQGGRVAIRVAVNITIQLLKGLGTLHELGIIHRDVKPENTIIVSTETGPRVYILDLGIVKNEGYSRTMTRDLVGTPAYMSPEMCVSAKKADRRSDLFAVGAILFELILGCSAFDGESQTATMYNVCHKPNPEMPTWVPTSLRGIVRRAIAKNPEERFSSAGEFIEELLKLTDEELDAKPTIAASANPEEPTAMVATGDPGFAGTPPAPQAPQLVAISPRAVTARIRANTPSEAWRRNKLLQVAAGTLILLVMGLGAFFLIRTKRPPTPSAATHDAAQQDAPPEVTPVVVRDAMATISPDVTDEESELVISTPPEAPAPDAVTSAPDASIPSRRNRRGSRDAGRSERPRHHMTPRCRDGYTLTDGHCCRRLGAGGLDCDGNE